MKKNFIREKSNKGFTLTEILVDVAILVILGGITVATIPIATSMKRNKLTATAETIFLAAQNRLTEMKANGSIGTLSTAGERTSAPSDKAAYTGKGEDPANTLDFITSEGMYSTAASFLFPTVDGATTVISGDVLSNSWVIEFDADSATVYAVFYSESKAVSEFYSPSSDNGDYREGTSNEVGYYGGSLPIPEPAEDLGEAVVSIQIVNGEELNAILHI